MKINKLLKYMLITITLISITACGGSSTSDKKDTEKTLPIVAIGPSTVYIAHANHEAVREDNTTDCRLEGWGERLYEFATDQDAIYNFARAGSNHNSFQMDEDEYVAFLIEEGKIKAGSNGETLTRNLFGPGHDHYWAKAKEKMQSLGKGILLIQFGGSNEDRISDNETKFKENLRLYTEEARSLHFTPIFVTDIEKRERTADGILVKSRGNFPTWMKEVAKEEGVRVLDLNSKSYQEYSKLSDAQWDEQFGDCYGKWGEHSKETTHFEPKGAKIVAGWIRNLACEEKESELCKALSGVPKSFTLRSSDFIPAHNSPKLYWENVPKGTKSFAVIIDDYSAKDGNLSWLHWTLFNIDKDIKSIKANSTPKGALVELNSNGNRSYADPLYPNSHKYVAHIYALGIADITKAQYLDGVKIYHKDEKYDHKRFEKIFGNDILGKSEISSKK